ncbi:MAG: hypothetical protein ABFE02_11215 [Sulfuricella sp.]
MAETGKKNSKKASANTLTVQQMKDETKSQVLARTSLRPSITGALAIEKFSGLGEMELPALVSSLAEQAEAVNGGDLTRAEAMLMTQAHTLDAIFSNLARRSAMNIGEYLNAAERYMRLALKAQSQCRATLQTLAELKNPQPVAFVQQANITSGPQQVNNGPSAGTSTNACAPARGENSKIQPNELLEEKPDERLDTRAPGAAGRANQALEAVGASNRAKND